MSAGTELADQGLVSFLQRVAPELRLPSRGDLRVTVTRRSSQESPCLAVPSIKVPKAPHPHLSIWRGNKSPSGLMRDLAHELLLPNSVHLEFTRECDLCIWGLSLQRFVGAACAPLPEM